MKNKVLFIFISLFVLLIGVNKISAYTIHEENGVVIDDNYILEKFKTTFSNFDEEEYNNIFCAKRLDNNFNFIECDFFPNKCLERPRGNDSSYLCESKMFRLSVNFDGSIRSSADYTSSDITHGFFFYHSNQDIIPYTNFEIEGSSYNEQVNVLFKSEPEPEEPEPEEYQIENKIYLPIELEENMCPYILDKDTIRVYDETPTQNSTVTYTDYFINSHYISKTGSETFENDVLMCLDKSKFTTAFYYRFDFDKIMIIFISMLAIVYVIFGKIIHSFFLGFRR